MIDQLVIGLCGITSVWLSQDAKLGRRKFACIFGLFAQPFWFYSALIAQQWGIVFLCFVYTAAWLRGLYTHWIIPIRSKESV